MKKLFTYVWVVLFGTGLVAQPTIDGSDTGDGDYVSLATWTQANTGFGDHGIVELKGYADATHLYIMMLGECESNFNDLFLFINSSSEINGLFAGSNLPSGSDGLSPFNAFTGKLDMEVDYGVRLTGDATQAYVSIINYTNFGNTDEFLATIANDGTPTTIAGGSYIGTEIAYKDAGTLSGRVGDEGWEIKIELADIGASAGDDFQLFAMYGNNDFISANTLPEIAGQSGNNLASNPDFTAIAGNQHTTAHPLPVELSSFTATPLTSTIQLDWLTNTEINNDYFDIEKSIDGKHYKTLGRVAGVGNSFTPIEYQFIDRNPQQGINYYRLKQVDVNGSFDYSSIIYLTFRGDNQIAIFPNPTADKITAEFSASTNANAVFQLINIDGKVAKEWISPINQGANSINIEVQNLASGIYLLNGYSEQDGQILIQSKFVKR